MLKKNNTIICEIIDNGIGIDESKRRKGKEINRRIFFGTQATENRIRLLYKKNVEISIVDISDDTSTGTKVRIVFPDVISEGSKVRRR